MDPLEAEDLGKAVAEVLEKWGFEDGLDRSDFREFGDALAKELEYTGLKVVRDRRVE